MKVAELTEIWGISKSKLQDYSKQYRWWSFGIYVIDIVVVLLLTAILYNSGASAKFYLYIIGLLCIIITLCLSYKLNTDTGIAYQFYNKVAKKTYAIEYYNLNEEVLYNILYCIGYRRLKSNKSMEIYTEMLITACCENAKNAYTIMKFMGRYAGNEETGTPVYVLQGKKKGFLGFVPESMLNKESIPLENQDNTEEISVDTE